MKILGFNPYHGDSAACLFVDGKLIAAAEEERFRRIKHWAGLPTSTINYILQEAKLSLGEIDHIAINRKPGVNNWRRIVFGLTHFPSCEAETRDARWRWEMGDGRWNQDPRLAVERRRPLTSFPTMTTRLRKSAAERAAVGKLSSITYNSERTSAVDDRATL